MLSLLGKSKNRLENVIFNFRCSIDSNNFKFSKYFYLTCITLFVKVSHQYFAALFFQKIYLFFESTKNLHCLQIDVKILYMFHHCFKLVITAVFLSKNSKQNLNQIHQ